MSLFLSDRERDAIRRGASKAPLNRFFWALVNRANRRAETPGLTDRSATVEWWHAAAEVLTDAAMAWALKPADPLGPWLRDAALSVARRPVDDWIGPFFRSHADPPTGHLETAHLSWSLAVALDLAPDVFSEAERDELRQVLTERAMPMCVRWLDRARHLSNWRCVLLAGLAVPAAVLDDAQATERALEEFTLCCDAFQPDGSYAESVQYANYAASTLALAAEALLRRDPNWRGQLPIERYARSARWFAASLLYIKPLDGWGPYPRPRVANFGDCGAIAAPSGDLLLHIAARAADALPDEAGLARHLFDSIYVPIPELPPHDRATFGFVNTCGFLTLPLLTQAVEPLAPKEADVPPVASFSVGDVLARDAWGGRTVLAARTGSEPLHVTGHWHDDLHSFILAHNGERLLVDPGHSCYRGLIHVAEMRTDTHNAISFGTKDGGELLQSHRLVRPISAERRLAAPVDRGARLLLAQREGEVALVASEASAAYGAPIAECTRVWLLCGAHALFTIDYVCADEPVWPKWHWVLNDRDGLLDLKVAGPDRIVARRGDAGMKLFHCAGGERSGPFYSYVHDAYHPLPNRRGEGASGSGLVMRWSGREARETLMAVHVVAVDDYGTVAGWHLKTDGDAIGLRGPGGSPAWRLTVDKGAATVVLEGDREPRRLELTRQGKHDWHLA